nr:hypothetical protein [Escherichia coli]
MKTQHDHHDRLSVRLSVIISRLLAGESLELKVLADELSQNAPYSGIFSNA